MTDRASRTKTVQVITVQAFSDIRLTDKPFHLGQETDPMMWATEYPREQGIA